MCVEKEGYLLELSRYIHLNPVRAGLAEKPEGYKWSNYLYYIWNKKEPEWLNTNWLLEEYGKNGEAAFIKYKGFVEAAIENPSEYPKEDIAGQAIMGSKAFIKKIIKGMKSGMKPEEITAKRRFERGIDLEELKDAICRHYKVKELINLHIPEERHGRLMFIFLSKKETSAFNREIAEIAGGISPSGVTHQYKRIIEKFEEDRNFLKKWGIEANTIMSISMADAIDVGKRTRQYQLIQL